MTTSNDCNLSDSLNLALGTYDMINILLDKNPKSPNIPIYLESLCVFMNKILDNSTPDHWTEEEFEMIEHICNELNPCDNE